MSGSWRRLLSSAWCLWRLGCVSQRDGYRLCRLAIEIGIRASLKWVSRLRCTGLSHRLQQKPSFWYSNCKFNTKMDNGSTNLETSAFATTYHRAFAMSILKFKSICHGDSWRLIAKTSTLYRIHAYVSAITGFMRPCNCNKWRISGNAPNNPISAS
jgi:hypothetical protein